MGEMRHMHTILVIIYEDHLEDLVIDEFMLLKLKRFNARTLTRFV
jgi:hypothetical protein